MNQLRTLAVASALVSSIAGVAMLGPLRSATAASIPPQFAQQGGGANGQPVGGISCDEQEGQRIHIHQHLVIFDHGKQVDIPANIGIPAAKRCIYWVHTHSPDGIIHIEAPLDRSFTLGDFFLVWGEALNKGQAAAAKAAKGQSLKVWVDGKPYSGDPRKIALKAHTDIVIEAGPPFPKPPRFTNWGTL